jgi:quinohemoprotein ethanol dehydrogenase
MAYDPKNDLLYIGVGNGSPWSHQQRSGGQGDNLFLSSIVALRPETGEYVWHYQTTPKDSWDYTATQQMILADITIDGRGTPVIMQAPKNGFFYVLNRLTGKLISAEKYTHVTWASHVDLATGRPVENPDVHYGAEQATVIYPGSLGGHNWHSMSYSPQTGLVYVPIHHVPAVYKQDKAFGQRASYWQTGTDWSETSLPENPVIAKQALAGVTGKLLAWDPVAQREVWSVAYPNIWNGGVLATAGKLIFQGSAEGEFAAFHAATGKKLWSFNAQGGMAAAPISYAIDGKQYIAILTGWGGAYPVAAGLAASRSVQQGMKSRLLVFALGDKQALSLLDREASKVIDARFVSYPVDPVLAEKGKSLYSYNCLFCHGDGVVSASPNPDLRYMSKEKHTLFKAIVLDGLFSSVGMPSFKDRLTASEAEAIQHYIISRSKDLLDQDTH